MIARNITRTTLLAAVEAAGALVSPKSDKPILTCVRLSATPEGIRVFGSGAAGSIDTAIVAEVEQPGEVAIDAKLLITTLRSAGGGTVTIDGDAGQKIRISSSLSTQRIVSMEVDGMPGGPSFEGADSFTMEASAFALALDRVRSTIPQADNRYGLAGVSFDGDTDGHLRLAATDGNRLTWAGTPYTGTLPRILRDRHLTPVYIVPTLAALAELGLPMVFNVGERVIEVRAGTTVLRYRVSEAEFPDYRQVIPATFKRVTFVERDELAAAVKRVGHLVATDDHHSARMVITADGLKLSTRKLDAGDAETEIACDLSGDPITTGVNLRYLSEALATIPSGRVRIRMGDVLSPIEITQDGVDAMWIVMPIRLG